MHPPPGFSPTLVLDDVPTTALINSAIATATSLMASSSTTLSSALSASTTVSSSLAKPTESPDNGECSLLGPFAIVVQGALGLLALLSLVYKRWKERPQRPIKIWFFDVSKQVVGSVLTHIANLAMSMLSSGQFNMQLEAHTVAGRSLGLVSRMVGGDEYKPNPCSFYLLNLAIDTTVGIPILILLLRVLTALFLMTEFGNPPESIQSGNYGRPPRTYWWFKQSMIYFIGLMGMKFCVLIIFLVLPWISRVGDWALRWTEGNEALQVIFAMLVFPLIMNAAQYYIIDSFIKNQKPQGQMVDDHSEDAETYEDPNRSSDDLESGDEDEEIRTKGASDKKVPTETVKSKKPKNLGNGSGSPLKTGTDYDPMYDGESSPTVVGRSSSSDVKGQK